MRPSKKESRPRNRTERLGRGMEMPTFADAVQKADETGAPVVEGFALQLQGGADATAVTA